MVCRYYIFLYHRRPFALQTPPTTAPRPSYTGSAISTSTLDSASGLNAESPLHIRLSSRGESVVTSGDKEMEEGNAHDDGTFYVLCVLFMCSYCVIVCVVFVIQYEMGYHCCCRRSCHCKLQFFYKLLIHTQCFSPSHRHRLGHEQPSEPAPTSLLVAHEAVKPGHFEDHQGQCQGGQSGH